MARLAALARDHRDLVLAEELRTLELARLDASLESLASCAAGLQGAIERGDLDAINTMVRIEGAMLRVNESRRKLQGLDAPEKTENSGALEIVVRRESRIGTTEAD